MRIKFLGTDDDNLTGSMTLLELPNKTHGLIDFGLTQFNNGNIASSMIHNGREFEFDVNDIDFVVITHAHVDHMGLLPLLVKRGFTGKIITTVPTTDFASVTLYDTVKIFESDCKWYNNTHKDQIYPIFNNRDVENTLRVMRGYDFNTEIFIDENTSVILRKAGHMLGACMPEIRYSDNGEEKVILFTGDTSGLTTRKPFLPPADRFGDIDYLVTESTYGNRVQNKVDVASALYAQISKTCIQDKGTLLIPVFSLQRSSEIIWMLREVYLSNPDIRKVPIYLDSPMAIHAQRIMDENREFWGERWLERDAMLGSIFDWRVVQYVEDFKESRYLANNIPKIILSSSGMCEGGRVLDHIKTFLPHKENHIMFTGHQVNGTIGHGIVNTTRGSIGVNGDRVDIRAGVSQIPFSGHADVNQLISLIQTSTKGKLKHIMITHGDMDAKLSFQDTVSKHIRGAKTTVPLKGKWYHLKS